MSAYSDWKFGLITDEEYRHACWLEDAYDRELELSDSHFTEFKAFEEADDDFPDE